jgi:hypothetical protein
MYSVVLHNIGSQAFCKIAEFVAHGIEFVAHGFHIPQIKFHVPKIQLYIPQIMWHMISCTTNGSAPLKPCTTKKLRERFASLHKIKLWYMTNFDSTLPKP